MTTLEMAIYSVSPGYLDRYPDARDKMRKVVSSWAGYISGVTFQSLGKETVFLDFYLWGNLDDALRAAESIKAEPDAQDFLSCIGDIIAYQHFEVGTEQPYFTDLDKGDVLEVALSVVDPDKQETFRSAKPELFDLVRQENGLKDIASAEIMVEDGILCLDVLRWETLDAANAAMESIHKTEQCGVFMTTFKREVYFDHMNKFD